MDSPPTRVLHVTVDDVILRLPRPVDALEQGRIAALLDDAEEIIADELAAAGRDLERDMLHRPGFAGTARRVAREMVAAVVLIGANTGQRSASSTTGAQSDSVTWSDTSGSRWGNPALTDEQRERLGLSAAGVPRGRFPASRIRRWLP